MSVPTDDPILDAAHAQVMKVGVKRTTLTDIASRAGVSRMTVYRRYPDVSTVLQALMTREFAALIRESADEAAELADGRDRVVRAAVHGAELLAAHPLFLRLLDVDPELLLPYVTERMGTFQRLVIDDLATRLAAAMDEGSVRRADPRRLASAIELALRGYVLAAHSDAPEQERVHREDLRDMIDAFLRP
jgi:AcrR family transcriptional regulator